MFLEMELLSLIFQEVTFWVRKVKKTHFQKVSHISGNENFYLKA